METIKDVPTTEKFSQVGNAAKCKRDNDKPMTLNEAIAHAEEAVNDTPCGREHKQLTDWLKELREIKNSNAAKMREALEDSQRLLENFAWGDNGAQVREQMRDNKAALSAPPRNCDRFDNWKDAFQAFYNSLAIEHPPMSDGVSAAFLNWLFAEAKGEAK